MDVSKLYWCPGKMAFSSTHTQILNASWCRDFRLLECMHFRDPLVLIHSWSTIAF